MKRYLISRGYYTVDTIVVYADSPNEAVIKACENRDGAEWKTCDTDISDVRYQIEEEINVET